jgi:hypothetical protein
MGEPKYHVSDIPATRFTTQKKTLRASQATSERVQRLRAEYWTQVKEIDFKNLVFLDEGSVSNVLLIFLKGALSAPFKKINNMSRTSPR